MNLAVIDRVWARISQILSEETSPVHWDDYGFLQAEDVATRFDRPNVGGDR